jgi:hypothetical protein
MTTNFQSLHAPRGAHAHFALGLFGGGGFAHESDRAASNDVFIGWKRGHQVACFPFFRNAQSAELAGFVGEQVKPSQLTISAFTEAQIERDFRWATDTWRAPRISFSIASHVSGIASPSNGDAFRNSILPALPARLTLDNRDSGEPLQGFFAVNGLRGTQLFPERNGVKSKGGLTGWQTIQDYGFACRPAPNIRAVSHWDLPSLFTPPHPLPFPLTGMGVLLVDVRAGEIFTLDFALGWYRGGLVTAGEQKLAYAYTQHYADLPAVLNHALDLAPQLWDEAHAFDNQLLASGLNPERQFILAQSTRSYWASTMLFSPLAPAGQRAGGEDEHTERSDSEVEARYVVNEGSFLMLNTLDLAVDHLFYELDHQPWVVRNILDHFADEYSYTDQCGLSFTHDQGAYNTFAPRGYSSYEVSGQEGCYAYMTQEQLLNWILAASLYLHKTDDRAWAGTRRELFARCLESMLQRDHPDPAQRDGLMDIDSSRAAGASEITTYDSLDPSLGQARRNLYLAVKGYAAYLALAWLFNYLDDITQTQHATRSAELCARSIVSAFDANLGFIPALLDGVDRSPIIPAIEALIYPYEMGILQENELTRCLRAHLETILKPGICIFDDGGWKLSAHSNNSWMSKIFICQHVAETVLGISHTPRADQTHADWWQLGCPSNPGIDQVFTGTTPEHNFFYPRAITSYLWLKRRA